MISPQEIKSLLSSQAANMDIAIYKCVTSTNDLAKEYAILNPKKEAVIIALEQTSGRGRRGRSFFSPDGSGLYMSILLRPDTNNELISLLTSCAAVSVAQSIEKVSEKKADIKWINDVYINNKKTCGILCEALFNSQKNSADYVIVGIGINLSDPLDGFPEDIKNIATSVFGNKKIDDGTFAKLCASIINILKDYSLNLSDREFITEYRERLCMLNSEISVITPTETYSAKAVDIDENAHLIVSLPDGSIRSLEAGEISIRQQKREC